VCNARIECCSVQLSLVFCGRRDGGGGRKNCSDIVNSLVM
jgi:hypothetical protein